ncbi:hypothetical protein [Parasphingorhabdus sp.]|uniref:hypothetical protein n=1 Tax=Parasphingorhabdus sp. TaxID=2709688 RepID=UPI00300310A8
MNWFEFKDWLEMSTGLDRNSLHIYAGIAVQLTAAFVFRRSLASPWPWLIVAVAAIANEIYDYSFVPEPQTGDAVHFDAAVRDLWNTLLLPSILLAIARWWPAMLTGPQLIKAYPAGGDGGGPEI